MKKHSAFSLIEISIIALIIALLTTAIIGGATLIKSARLSGARSLTTKSIVPELQSLVAWYETSRLDSLKAGEIPEGAQTTEWYDISPSSIILKKNKLSRAASNNVVFVGEGINKIPSLKFDGTGKISLSGFYQGASRQHTIFLVIRPIDIQNPSIVLDSYDTNNPSSIGIKTNAVNFNDGTSSDTGTASNAANFNNNNNYILAVYFNHPNSKAYVNNATNEAGAGVVNNGNTQLKGLTIGTNRNGNNGFNGLISEVIIYNRPLQLQERKDVMAYLSKKYKISVTGI